MIFAFWLCFVRCVSEQPLSYLTITSKHRKERNRRRGTEACLKFITKTKVSGTLCNFGYAKTYPVHSVYVPVLVTHHLAQIGLVSTGLYQMFVDGLNSIHNADSGLTEKS